jgi:phospholipase/carboxylesterase
MTPVFRMGPAAAAARLTVILVHGRGASAGELMRLPADIAIPDIAYVAPEAPGRSWYPYSFLAPFEKNEPHLTQALATLEHIVEDLHRQHVATERIALLGFSQGACLSLEFAARHSGRYAAIVAFSGGLIGPPGTPRTYPGSFAGTPVFLGCSDIDAHIPLERVHESTEVFRRMGASVDERIYPGMDHTITKDEIEAATALLSPTSRASHAIL